jgi:hypothetical protein
MTHKQSYWLMISLLSLILLSSIVLTINIGSVFDKKSIILSQSQNQITLLQQKQLSLASAKAELKRYQSLYSIAKTVVPQYKDQTQTVRQIINIANQNNVSISSITFPASSLGLNNGGPAVAGEVVPKNINQNLLNNPNLSQLTPVPKIPGLYSLPITITSSSQTSQLATFSQFINFLQGLEDNRQTAQITSLIITPSSQNSNLVSFNISLNIYINPKV